MTLLPPPIIQAHVKTPPLALFHQQGLNQLQVHYTDSAFPLPLNLHFQYISTHCLHTNHEDKAMEEEGEEEEEGYNIQNSMQIFNDC